MNSEFIKLEVSYVNLRSGSGPPRNLLTTMPLSERYHPNPGLTICSYHGRTAVLARLFLKQLQLMFESGQRNNSYWSPDVNNIKF